MNTNCNKCHNKGMRYQIDGSITTIKPCDCEVAKEQQNNFTSWASEFKRKLELRLQAYE